MPTAENTSAAKAYEYQALTWDFVCPIASLILLSGDLSMSSNIEA